MYAGSGPCEVEKYHNAINKKYFPILNRCGRLLLTGLQFDDDLSLKNPLFQNVNQPGIGQHLVPTHPAKFSEFDRKSAEKAPILGAHTEEILLEVMKLPEAEVASLFDNRIVAGPN